MSEVTLTVACPEADRDDATHLGVALGWLEDRGVPEEWQHCFRAQFQDADGALYRVMSMQVSAGFVATAALMGPINRPPADVGPDYIVNLTGARRAQDKLAVWQPGDAAVPQVGATRIVAVVGMDGPAALVAMGLQALSVNQ